MTRDELLTKLQQHADEHNKATFLLVDELIIPNNSALDSNMHTHVATINRGVKWVVVSEETDVLVRLGGDIGVRLRYPHSKLVMWAHDVYNDAYFRVLAKSCYMLDSNKRLPTQGETYIDNPLAELAQWTSRS